MAIALANICPTVLFIKLLCEWDPIALKIYVWPMWHPKKHPSVMSGPLSSRKYSVASKKLVNIHALLTGAMPWFSNIFCCICLIISQQVKTRPGKLSL